MKALLKIITTLSLSALIFSGLEAASIESLTKRINRYANLAQLHVQRAQLHINNKDYDSASKDLNRAILINPNLEEAQLFLAEILIEEKHENEAIKLLNSLLVVSKKQDTHIQAYQYLGDIYMSQNEAELALNAYKKIFNKNVPYEEEYYMKMADAYYSLGEFKNSIKVLKLGLSTMIKKEKIQEKMVDISMLEGNFTLALSVLDKMIADDSTKARLYYKRARIFKEQGKIKEMNVEIKKAKVSLIKNENNTLQAQELHIELKNLYARL